ncbi:MAG: ABC transporter permease [Planctomycetaceae bacterium]
MTSTTPTSDKPALTELPRGESQWAMIGREFRKRTTAVICYLIIVILAAVSIFAPFLANDRPIAYRGWNGNEYNEARKAAAALIGQLVQPPVDAQGQPLDIDSDSLRRSIRDRLSEMQAAVIAEQGENIAALRQRFNTAAEATDKAALQTLQSDVLTLNARKMEFHTRWRFPVFAQLNGVDIGFMVAALLFLSAPIWRWLLRKQFGRMHPAINQTTWALVLGLPTLLGLGWWLLVPAQNDLTAYKRGRLMNVDVAVLKRAPVVYDSVLWPVIPYGLDENDLDSKKSPPPWWHDQERAQTTVDNADPPNGLPAKPTHWLGTDNLGRDLACRMIWGGRVSLAVGVVAVGIYVAIGVVVGAIAGYFRGWVDMLISRLIEVMICFPSFFLILAIVAFVGPSMWVIMVVIGLTSWTGVARLVRAEFLRLSGQEFVLAGRVLGYSPLRLIFKHVLPNAMAPVLVAATFGVAGAILTESALSFLGLGITIPKPSWGGILSDGRDAIFSAGWIIFLPGLAIFITITCYNLVGEAFRDAADPRLRGSR